MVEHVAEIIRELGLPFRILKLCGGDISFTSALTYDFEVYSIAQEKWLEVSSVSNFESYQSNRLKLRFKDENKKNTLCHKWIFLSTSKNYGCANRELSRCGWY